MYKFLFIFLALFFVACSSEETYEDFPDEEPKEIQKAAVSNEKLENKRNAIEANLEEFDIANSLSFRHNDGSTEEVIAFIDKEKNILKIDERFSDGKTGSIGSRVFYLEAGKKYLSIERFADNVHAKGAYRERISYYDMDGNVLSTKQRLAQFEEDLEKLPFVDAEKFDCSMQTADEVLNNKGVYSTTFQGFVDNEHLTYLLVGGPGETGYASALVIQYEDEQIKKMKANQEAFVDKPLSVQFEKMLDEKDLEFQVLMSMQLEK